MTSKPIDVWNAGTFDPELTALLERHIDLIRGYMETDRRIFLSHDLGRGRERNILRPQNPYASEFVAHKEAVGEVMRSRNIRAWHYTRLTDAEAMAMLRDGVHLSTAATLRARLDALVFSAELTKEKADALYSASPFHSDQRKSRSNKFWMNSHPIVIEDRGVEPLVANWGGEVASAWMRDPALLSQLAVTGRPRVVELGVPMAITQHSYSAGQAVIATFGRTLGCIPEKHDFDLFVTAPLRPTAILAVHSEGDPTFGAVGRTYPSGFVDANVGRWKELTGEDN